MFRFFSLCFSARLAANTYVLCPVYELERETPRGKDVCSYMSLFLFVF